MATPEATITWRSEVVLLVVAEQDLPYLEEVVQPLLLKVSQHRTGPTPPLRVVVVVEEAGWAMLIEEATPSSTTATRSKALTLVIDPCPRNLTTLCLRQQM